MNPPCLICSSPTTGKEDRGGRLFHFCSHCHFVSLDQQFHLTFEEERQRYKLHNNDSDNEGYKQWLSAFGDAAVRPFVSQHSRILDFGCGPNPLLKIILEREGYTVEIYDKHFFVHPFEGKFDMIISTEVIEHIYNPLEQIQNLKLHLKTGGCISLKTSFRPVSDEAFLNWWYKEDRTHISFFSPEAVKSLSEKLGLEVLKCDNKSIIILRK